MRVKLIILFTLFTLPLMAGVEYKIIPLEPADYKPGSSMELESEVYDLSESGYVVGSIRNHPQFPITTKGFIYHPDEGFRVIVGPLLRGDLKATKVNNRGMVAGWINREEWQQNNWSYSCGYDEMGPFVFDPKSELLVEMASLDETKDYKCASTILGITDDGKVLVDGWDDSEYVQKSYIYDIDSGAVNTSHENPIAINNRGDLIGSTWFYSSKNGQKNFGSLDPYKRWDAHAEVLNENGVVAGYGNDVHGDQKGFLWDEEKGLRVINSLGGESVDINSINNRSQVVGSSGTDDLDTHAFIFEESVGIIDLGTLGGGESSAHDINDLTQVVGWAEHGARAKGERAFIWDPVKGMRDLNDLIPKNSGWKSLETAKKINNQGFIIGNGIYRGEERGFLLIPTRH